MDQSTEKLTEAADDGPNRSEGIDRLGKPEDRLRLIVNFLNSSPNLVDCDSYEETEGIGYLQMGLVEGVNVGQLHSSAAVTPGLPKSGA